MGIVVHILVRLIRWLFGPFMIFGFWTPFLVMKDARGRIVDWFGGLLHRVWGDDERAMKRMPRKREEGDV